MFRRIYLILLVIANISSVVYFLTSGRSEQILNDSIESTDYEIETVQMGYEEKGWYTIAKHKNFLQQNNLPKQQRSFKMTENQIEIQKVKLKISFKAFFSITHSNDCYSKFSA